MLVVTSLVLASPVLAADELSDKPASVEPPVELPTVEPPAVVEMPVESGSMVVKFEEVAVKSTPPQATRQVMRAPESCFGRVIVDQA